VSAAKKDDGRARDHHDDEQALGSLFDKRLLGRLLEFARPYRWAIFGSIALLVGGLFLKLAGPWIIKEVLDGPVSDAAGARATAAANGTALDLAPQISEVTRLALTFLVVVVVYAGTLVFREWLMNRTGQKIVFDLRNTIFRHMLRLPVGWHDRHAVGWSVTRSTSDVDAVSEMFTTGVATIAYDILTILVTIVVLIWLSPKLAIVALVILPVMMWVSFRFRLNARRAYRATRASLARLNAFLQERLTGLAIVRLFRREGASARRFDKLNTRYYDDNMVTVRHFSIFFPIVDTLAQGVKMGTMVWGSWLVFDGQLTLGVFFQIWLYLDLIFEPIRELAERYNVLQAAMAAGERIFGILDTRSEEAAPIAAVTGRVAGRGEPPRPRGSRGRAAPGRARHRVPARVLQLPRRTARAEGRVLQGRARRARGAGRTHRRWQDHHGQPAVPLPRDAARPRDGRRTGRLLAAPPRPAQAHRDRATGRVPVQRHHRLQHPHGRRDHGRRSRRADGRHVARMAATVHADSFVGRLPDGLQTVLQERGSNLSSGQRQLIAFARALAADPEILVLDEATSSVDSETESLIEDATARLMEGRTSLVIAHRLSTIVSADRILVMHKGRLHEQGTHAELMANRDLYWKLYRLHLAGAPI
jgi:ATP-binding cassette subfamily B protein